MTRKKINSRKQDSNQETIDIDNAWCMLALFADQKYNCDWMQWWLCILHAFTHMWTQPDLKKHFITFHFPRTYSSPLHWGKSASFSSQLLCHHHLCLMNGKSAAEMSPNDLTVVQTLTNTFSKIVKLQKIYIDRPQTRQAIMSCLSGKGRVK